MPMDSGAALRIMQASRRGGAGGAALLVDQQYGKQAPEADANPVGPSGGGIPAPTPAAGPPPEKPVYRWLITYGPEPGQLVLGLEEAPDWELTYTRPVACEAVVELITFLRLVAPVKDLTGLFPKVPREVPRELATQPVPGPAAGAASDPGGGGEAAESEAADGRGDAAAGPADAALRAGRAAAGPGGPRTRAALVRGALPGTAVSAADGESR